ncbi:MAG: glycosyltransferase family 39 protein [Chloroflexi bacterium]|nr:glycosyltransferase family 39 protein [Chloroflexota bacterium]
MSAVRLERKQVVIGLILAACTMAAVIGTVHDVGVTWDEPLYMKAARGYMSWLGLLKQGMWQRDLREPFSDTLIVRWWMQHPTLELHPPLGKFLSGLTWAALRGVLGDITAQRVSNALLFSFLVALVFWMVAGAYGTASGVFAALSLVLMPRMFFHAHLANIDTTVAITWFLAMYLFWKYESGRGWRPILLTGAAFGLALGTKLNAIVMPLVWGIWWLLFDRNWRTLGRLIVMSAIGVGVFTAIWPWLYHDTVNRLLYYFFMASRFKDRPQFYLGQTPPHVPWHYPFVITLAVVPLVITVMYLLGVIQVLRKRSDRTGWLLFLNALVPLLIAATPFQAVYSGERHFIPAYPYLACLAGIGFGSLLNLLSAGWHRFYKITDPRTMRWLFGCILALFLLPPLFSIADIHPYELSYYSELVGGLPGATRLGLETTFWCETYRDALPYLNQNAEPWASVWAENPFVLRLYQRYNLLREDLQIMGGDVVSPFTADYVVIQMHQTGFYHVPELVDMLHNHAPVYMLDYHGIPLLYVYELRQER